MTLPAMSRLDDLEPFHPCFLKFLIKAFLRNMSPRFSDEQRSVPLQDAECFFEKCPVIRQFMNHCIGKN